MADIKSKSNEGKKKSHDNAVKKKGAAEKLAAEKEKQTQHQQHQNHKQNQNQNQNSQSNNKNPKKKQQQQQQKQQPQQQENTVKKINVKKSKDVVNKKNVKDKKKEVKTKGYKKPAKQVNVNKPKGSFRKFLETFFLVGIISMAFLWYLYIVDIERYRSVRDLGVNAMYSVVQLLPKEVVAKGQDAIEFIRPTVEVAVVKLQVLVNQTSTVLNTNPVLKDHWSNLNEISAVIGEQIAGYMRTVYKQIPIFYDNAKNKLF